MAATDNLIHKLKPWDNQVSIDGQCLELLEYGDDYSLDNLDGEANLDGFYAQYHEGTFVLFQSKSGQLKIGWNGKLLELSKVKRTRWYSNIKGRCLVCFDGESNELLRINYHTISRFKLNPFKILAEVFTPDDDWGLVADLPSFLNDFFDRGCSISDLENLLT